MSMQLSSIALFLFSLVVLAPACTRTSPNASLGVSAQDGASSHSTLLEFEKEKGVLSSVHVIDFNGFSETISNKERLSQFEGRNFLCPQQYKKVLRVFRRKDGRSIGLITLYHGNGQVHRYLECLNGRASGNFREWYDNGKLKIEARVASGAADVDDRSIETWAFDGISRAWGYEGEKLGVFPYDKGLLDGESVTYYPSGQVEWTTNYKSGRKEGIERHFYEDGSLFEEISYQDGLRNGVCLGYWPSGRLQYEEEFELDSLNRGRYYSKSQSYNQLQDPISEVSSGNGIRSIFVDDFLESQYQISQGKPSGWVKMYSEDGTLLREHIEISGEKDGKEVLYFPKGEGGALRPKLSIEWRKGVIHGIVETWYPDGALQSRREMKQNEKDGISMSWYPDGNLMFLEEYEKGILRKGRYHKRGELSPCSVVEAGKGIATIFDSGGFVTEKINYLDGKPVVEDVS